MIFLRILRVFLVVAGLAVLGVAYLAGLSTQDKGSQYLGSWVCDPSPGTPGRTECTASSLREHNHDDIPALGLGGLGLIGAALAVGQFDRRPAPATPAAPAAPAVPGGPAPTPPGGAPMPQGWRPDPRDPRNYQG
jgi:hypothetical protein